MLRHIENRPKINSENNNTSFEREKILIKEKICNYQRNEDTYKKILWDKIFVDFKQINEIYKEISNQEEFIEKSIEALNQLQAYIRTELFRWDFWIDHNIPVVHGLRNALEREYVITEREKIKVQENVVRNINELKKELRYLWKEVLTCMNSLKLFD